MLSPMMAAGAGAASSGLLGQLSDALGAPRRAVMSGLYNMGLGQSPDSDQKASSLLPLLLGGAAGVGSAFIPGVGALAPMIGAGVGGLAQGIMEGGGYSDAIDTQDVTGSENPFLNASVGMALDPLSWSGAGVGAKFASKGQGPISAARMQRAVSVPLGSASMAGALPAEEQAAAALAKSLSPGTMIDSRSLPLPFPPTAALPEVGQTGYNAEQLGQMFGTAAGDLSPMGAARAAPYKNVNPQVSGLLQELGFMDSGNQMAGQLPAWAQVRGGRVMPNPEMGNTISQLSDLSGLGGNGAEARQLMMQRLALQGAPPPGMINPLNQSQSGADQLQRLAEIQARLRQMQGGA